MIEWSGMVKKHANSILKSSVLHITSGVYAIGNGRQK